MAEWPISMLLIFSVPFSGSCTCNPANVRGAPVDVRVRLVVEGVLEGGGRVQHVSRRTVQDSLRFTLDIRH